MQKYNTGPAITGMYDHYRRKTQERSLTKFTFLTLRAVKTQIMPV